MVGVVPDRHDGDMELLAADTAPIVCPLRAGAGTAAGHRRPHNEDSLLCGPTWFAVADGMGGHQAGEVASGIAIDCLRSRPPLDALDDLPGVTAEINASIRGVARRDGTTGMGTTLVAATPVAGGIAVVHVGDSRCYRLAEGVLTQLTRDHSHVQELVDLGEITVADARRHRFRSIVTRALGVDPVVEPDTVFVPAPVGRLLLCSDGLTAELSPTAIGRVLAGIVGPQAAADRLVELALRGAARDNITAVVVDVREARA